MKGTNEMSNLWEAAEQRERESSGGQLEVRINQQIGLLDWNFDELNRQLDEQLAKYDDLTFTDAEMNDAKKVRANLNKVAKVINDRKIAVKKEFCEPYERFADQAKALTGKIQAVSGKIDQQVKDFEARQKEAKRQQIADWWEANGIKGVQLRRVWDERYLNTGYSEQAWIADLSAKKERTRQELAVISQMTPAEKVDWCLSRYLQSLDLAETFSAWEREQESRRQAEEMKARLEAEKAERARREAEKPADEEIPTPAKKSPETNEKPAIPANKEVWWTYTVEIQGTAEDLRWFGEQIRARKSLTMKVIERKKEER